MAAILQTCAARGVGFNQAVTIRDANARGLAARLFASGSPVMNPHIQSYVLSHDTPVDPGLQSQLERIDSTLRAKCGMTTEQAAVGLLDLQTLRLAMIHPDR